MTSAAATAPAHEAVEVLQEWRRLAEQRGNAFITPEWFSSWLAGYGDRCTPSIQVVADAGRGATALLPLVRTRGRLGATLRFAGGSLADVLEPVAPAGEEDVAVELLGRQMRNERAALVLDNVEGSWPMRLAEAMGNDVVATSCRGAALPFVAFDGLRGDDYLASLSRNLRSQLKRKRAAFERRHGVGFRLSDDVHVDRDLDELFRLHDARWRGRGGSSLESERARTVLRDFALAALERGWLRLWVLEADDRPAAAWYGWRVGDRYVYYTAGFDPAFGEFSPGLLLLVHSMTSAADEGAATYEFLLGDESYKARFATGLRTVRTFVIAPRLHPARVAAAAEERARALTRRLPPRLRELVHAGARPVARGLPTSRRR